MWNAAPEPPRPSSRSADTFHTSDLPQGSFAVCPCGNSLLPPLPRGLKGANPTLCRGGTPHPGSSARSPHRASIPWEPLPEPRARELRCARCRARFLFLFWSRAAQLSFLPAPLSHSPNPSPSLASQHCQGRTPQEAEPRTQRGAGAPPAQNGLWFVRALPRW